MEWRQHVWGVAVRFGFFWVLEAGFCTISKEIFFFWWEGGFGIVSGSSVGPSCGGA